MHRCHNRFLDADPATNNLHNRRNTVGRTTRTSNDMSVSVHRIDAVDNRNNVITLRRGRENDILGARLNVLLEIFFFGKHTRTLKDNIYSQAGPWKLGWILFTEVAASFPSNDEVFSLPLYCPVIPSINSIVLEQINDIFDGHNIIDRH